MPTEFTADRQNMAKSPRDVVPLMIEGKFTRIGAATGGAAFISQLIAERHHMAPQRERRRATMAVAVGSYAATQEQSLRRLPPGYRKAMLV
jgi:hypothetical protein